MGDPKKARKKYRTPSHPWRKERLDEESALAIEYGLKNKKEIWNMNTMHSNFAHQSKKLVTIMTKQAEQEKLQLIKRLKKLGLLKENQDFDDILNITIKDVMERRLQTLVHRKGLAKTMKQARQFITHSHIIIGDKKIESPAYLVSVEEEKNIGFVSQSALSSAEHPERIIKEKNPVKKKTPLKSKDKKEISKEKKEDKKEPSKEIKPKVSKKKKAEDKESPKVSKEKKDEVKKEKPEKTEEE